jgi:hypothetical protein
MQTTFKNISEHNLLAVETQTKTFHAIVEHATSGIFTVTLFTCRQILLSLEDWADKFIPKDAGQLAVRLFRAIENMNGEPSIQISLERSQVETLKKMLEARMLHCEKERDNRQEDFNPDTYISQKLLLLDIREWLMAYSVQIGNELSEKDIPKPQLAVHAEENY